MSITTRMIQPGVLFLAIGLLALGLRPGAAPAAQDVRLPFAAGFAGTRHGSSVWEGEVRGQPGGRVRLMLRQVENPLEAAKPVWHVRAHWIVEPEPPTGSLAAALEGVVDWKTGSTLLGGVVTSGWMKGAWVQQTGRFENGDLLGTLTIAPPVATR